MLKLYSCVLRSERSNMCESPDQHGSISRYNAILFLIGVFILFSLPEVAGNPLYSMRFAEEAVSIPPGDFGEVSLLFTNNGTTKITIQFEVRCAIEAEVGSPTGEIPKTIELDRNDVDKPVELIIGTDIEVKQQTFYCTVTTEMVSLGPGPYQDDIPHEYTFFSTIQWHWDINVTKAELAEDGDTLNLEIWNEGNSLDWFNVWVEQYGSEIGRAPEFVGIARNDWARPDIPITGYSSGEATLNVESVESVNQNNPYLFEYRFSMPEPGSGMGASSAFIILFLAVGLGALAVIVKNRRG